MTTRAEPKQFQYAKQMVEKKKELEEAELTFKPKLVSQQNPKIQSALYRQKPEKSDRKESGM